MTEGLWGALIGGILTLIGTYLNGAKEDKRFNKQIEHENKKLQRELKLERLYKVLVPIIGIYEYSETNISLIDPYVLAIGRGLESNSIADIKRIVEENTDCIPVDLIKLYYNTESTYKSVMTNHNIEWEIKKLEEEGEIVLNCIFDEDRLFISQIEQEARDIEDMYK